MIRAKDPLEHTSMYARNLDGNEKKIKTYKYKMSLDLYRNTSSMKFIKFYKQRLL